MDFTCIALLVFNVDAGVFVDIDDRDDTDDPAAVTVDGDARLQLCIFGPLAFPIPSFLVSWKRAPISDFA